MPDFGARKRPEILALHGGVPSSATWVTLLSARVTLSASAPQAGASRMRDEVNRGGLELTRFR